MVDPDLALFQALLQEGASHIPYRCWKLRFFTLVSVVVGLGLAILLSSVLPQDPSITMAWERMHLARSQLFPQAVRTPFWAQQSRVRHIAYPVSAQQPVQTAAAEQKAVTSSDAWAWAAQKKAQAIPVTDNVESPSSDSRSASEEVVAKKQRGDGGVGVLLLNLGGPPRLEDVEPFLYNLFADPNIIRLPSGISWLQKPLASLASKLKTPTSSENYAAIGGGSPLSCLTQEQAKALDSAIAKRLEVAPEQLSHLLGSVPVKSYIAMRYWHPFTEEALEQISADGISKLVILPLYPHFSVSTTGSSLCALEEQALERWNMQHVEHTVVPYWYQRPGYIEAMRRIVTAEVQQYSAEQRQEGVHVLFSAHGIPTSYVEAGDPYQVQTEHCVDMIRKGLPEDVKVHLSWQSRVGPTEWLRPYTDDKLEDLGSEGVRNLVVVPISFVSEHIETLQELDIEYREIAEKAGITGWRRAPTLNTDEAFIQDLASAVIEALQAPSMSVTEVCKANNVTQQVIQSAKERPREVQEVPRR